MCGEFAINAEEQERIPQTALILTLVGNLVLTSYRSLPNQTDDTPYYTSIGERVHPHGVAVSRDLLCPLAKDKYKIHNRNKCLYRSKLHYGDWLYVEGFGLKTVNNVMAARHKGRIDVWVSSYPQEKQIGTRKVRVYEVHI